MPSLVQNQPYGAEISWVFSSEFPLSSNAPSTMGAITYGGVLRPPTLSHRPDLSLKGIRAHLVRVAWYDLGSTEPWVDISQCLSNQFALELGSDMLLSCKLCPDTYDQELLQQSVVSILESTELCSMATLNDVLPHISTAYFCYTPNLAVYFLSPPTAQHSLNLAKSPAIALTIFDSSQAFAKPKRGLQLFGRCWLTREADAREAFHVYTKRFPHLLNRISRFEDYEAGGIQSRFYQVEINSLKIFDEPRFGKDIWIIASVQSSEKKQ
jgi:uncharacterized protein YhbP (UPF0306 family)